MPRTATPLVLPEQAAPGTPASGRGVLYVKTDGTIAFKNDAGVETVLGSGGSPSWPLDHTGAAGDDALTLDVTGDTQLRLIVNHDGTLEWGPGNATQDVNLYRGGADELKTDDDFIARASGAGIKIGAHGPSSKAALSFGITGDTLLYRDAADTFRTPDSLIVDGSLQRAGVNVVTSPDILQVELLTQAEYDALGSPSATTLYIITDGGAVQSGAPALLDDASVISGANSITYLTTSPGTSLVDIDATNLKVTGTVPENGRLRIRLSGHPQATSSQYCRWGLRDASGVVANTSRVVCFSSGLAAWTQIDYDFLTLTPGAAFDYRFAWSSSSGAVMFASGPDYGPVKIEAWEW